AVSRGARLGAARRRAARHHRAVFVSLSCRPDRYAVSPEPRRTVRAVPGLRSDRGSRHRKRELRRRIRRGWAAAHAAQAPADAVCGRAAEALAVTRAPLAVALPAL